MNLLHFCVSAVEIFIISVVMLLPARDSQKFNMNACLGFVCRTKFTELELTSSSAYDCKLGIINGGYDINLLPDLVALIATAWFEVCNVIETWLHIACIL